MNLIRSPQGSLAFLVLSFLAQLFRRRTAPATPPSLLLHCLIDLARSSASFQRAALVPGEQAMRGLLQRGVAAGNFFPFPERTARRADPERQDMARFCPKIGRIAMVLSTAASLPELCEMVIDIVFGL